MTNTTTNMHTTTNNNTITIEKLNKFEGVDYDSKSIPYDLFTNNKNKQHLPVAIHRCHVLEKKEMLAYMELSMKANAINRNDDVSHLIVPNLSYYVEVMTHRGNVRSFCKFPFEARFGSITRQYNSIMEIPFQLSIIDNNVDKRYLLTSVKCVSHTYEDNEYVFLNTVIKSNKRKYEVNISDKEYRKQCTILSRQQKCRVITSARNNVHKGIKCLNEFEKCVLVDINNCKNYIENFVKANINAYTWYRIVKSRIDDQKFEFPKIGVRDESAATFNYSQYSDDLTKIDMKLFNKSQKNEHKDLDLGEFFLSNDDNNNTNRQYIQCEPIEELEIARKKYSDIFDMLRNIVMTSGILECKQVTQNRKPQKYELPIVQPTEVRPKLSNLNRVENVSTLPLLKDKNNCWSHLPMKVSGSSRTPFEELGLCYKPDNLKISGPQKISDIVEWMKNALYDPEYEYKIREWSTYKLYTLTKEGQHYHISATFDKKIALTTFQVYERLCNIVKAFESDDDCISVNDPTQTHNSETKYHEPTLAGIDTIEKIANGLGTSAKQLLNMDSVSRAHTDLIQKLAKPALQLSGKPPIQVSLYIEQSIMDKIKSDWPEFDIIPSRVSNNPHTYYATSRKAVTKFLIKLFPRNNLLIDIGGDFATHVVDGNLHVHSCFKHDSPEDEARWINLNIRAREDAVKKLNRNDNATRNNSTDNDNNDIMVNNPKYQRLSTEYAQHVITNTNKAWCGNNFGECDKTPVNGISFAMSVDTLYRITPAELLRGYAQKKIIKAVHAITLPVDYKYKDAGKLTFNEGVWRKHNGDLIMTFMGESQPYINSCELIDFYLNTPIILGNDFLVYSKVSGRRGAHVIIEHFIMSRTVLVTGSLKHALHQTEDDTLVMLVPEINIKAPVSLLGKQPFTLIPRTFNWVFLERLLNRMRLPYDWDKLNQYAGGLKGKNYVGVAGQTRMFDLSDNDIDYHLIWAYTMKSENIEKLIPLVKAADKDKNSGSWVTQMGKAIKNFLLEIGRDLDPTDNEFMNSFVAEYSTDSMRITRMVSDIGMSRDAYNSILEMGPEVQLVDVIANQFNINITDLPNLHEYVTETDTSPTRSVMVLVDRSDLIPSHQCVKSKHCYHDHNVPHVHNITGHSGIIKDCTCCGITSSTVNAWCMLCLEHDPCVGKSVKCGHKHLLKNDECCGKMKCICDKKYFCNCCLLQSVERVCRVCYIPDDSDSSESNSSGDESVVTDASGDEINDSFNKNEKNTSNDKKKKNNKKINLTDSNYNTNLVEIDDLEVFDYFGHEAYKRRTDCKLITDKVHCHTCVKCGTKYHHSHNFENINHYQWTRDCINCGDVAHTSKYTDKCTCNTVDVNTITISGSSTKVISNKIKVTPISSTNISTNNKIPVDNNGNDLNSITTSGATLNKLNDDIITTIPIREKKTKSAMSGFQYVNNANAGNYIKTKQTKVQFGDFSTPKYNEIDIGIITKDVNKQSNNETITSDKPVTVVSNTGNIKALGNNDNAINSLPTIPNNHENDFELKISMLRTPSGSYNIWDIITPAIQCSIGYWHQHQCINCKCQYQHEHFYTTLEHYQTTTECPHCNPIGKIMEIYSVKIEPSSPNFKQPEQFIVSSIKAFNFDDRCNIQPGKVGKTNKPVVLENIQNNDYLKLISFGNTNADNEFMTNPNTNIIDDISEEEFDQDKIHDLPDTIDNKIALQHQYYLPDKTKEMVAKVMLPKRPIEHIYQISAIVLNYEQVEGDGLCGANSLSRIYGLPLDEVIAGLEKIKGASDMRDMYELGAWALGFNKNLIVTTSVATYAFHGNTQDWWFDAVVGMDAIDGTPHWNPGHIAVTDIVNTQRMEVLSYNLRIAEVAAYMEKNNGMIPDKVEMDNLVTYNLTPGSMSIACDFKDSVWFDLWLRFPGTFEEGKLIHKSKSFGSKKLTDYIITKPSGLQICYAPTGMGKTTGLHKIVDGRILIITPSVATVTGSYKFIQSSVPTKRVVGRAQSKWWSVKDDATNANVHEYDIIIMTVASVYARLCNGPADSITKSIFHNRKVILDEVHMITPDYLSVARMLGNKVKLIMSATPEGVTPSTETKYPVTSIFTNEPLHESSNYDANGMFIVTDSIKSADKYTNQLKQDLPKKCNAVSIHSKSLKWIDINTVNAGGCTESITTGATVTQAKTWVDTGDRWYMYYSGRSEPTIRIWSKSKRCIIELDKINIDNINDYEMQVAVHDSNKYTYTLSECIQSRGRVGRVSAGVFIGELPEKTKNLGQGEILEYCLKARLPIPSHLKILVEEIKNIKIQSKIKYMDKLKDIAKLLHCTEQVLEEIGETIRNYYDWLIAMQRLCAGNLTYVDNVLTYSDIQKLLINCVENPGIFRADSRGIEISDKYKTIVSKQSNMQDIVRHMPSINKDKSLRVIIENSCDGHAMMGFGICIKCLFLIEVKPQFMQMFRKLNFSNVMKEIAHTVIDISGDRSDEINKQLAEVSLSMFINSYNAMLERCLDALRNGYTMGFKNSTYLIDYTLNIKKPKIPKLKNLHKGEIGIMVDPMHKVIKPVTYDGKNWIGSIRSKYTFIVVHMHNNNHLLVTAAMLFNVQSLRANQCIHNIKNCKVYTGPAGTGKTTMAIRNVNPTKNNERTIVISKQTHMLKTVLKEIGISPLTAVLKFKEYKSCNIIVDEISLFNITELMLLFHLYGDSLIFTGDMSQKLSHSAYIEARTTITVLQLLKYVKPENIIKLNKVYRFGNKTGDIINKFITETNVEFMGNDEGIEFRPLGSFDPLSVAKALDSTSVTLMYTLTNENANVLVNAIGGDNHEVTTTGRAQGSEADYTAYFLCRTPTNRIDESELYVALTRHKKKCIVFYDQQGGLALRKFLPHVAQFSSARKGLVHDIDFIQAFARIVQPGSNEIMTEDMVKPLIMAVRSVYIKLNDYEKVMKSNITETKVINFIDDIQIKLENKRIYLHDLINTVLNYVVDKKKHWLRKSIHLLPKTIINKFKQLSDPSLWNCDLQYTTLATMLSAQRIPYARNEPIYSRMLETMNDCTRKAFRDIICQIEPESTSRDIAISVLDYCNRVLELTGTIEFKFNHIDYIDSVYAGAYRVNVHYEMCNYSVEQEHRRRVIEYLTDIDVSDRKGGNKQSIAQDNPPVPLEFVYVGSGGYYVASQDRNNIDDNHDNEVTNSTIKYYTDLLNNKFSNIGKHIHSSFKNMVENSSMLTIKHELLYEYNEDKLNYYEQHLHLTKELEGVYMWDSHGEEAIDDEYDPDRYVHLDNLKDDILSEINQIPGTYDNRCKSLFVLIIENMLDTIKVKTHECWVEYTQSLVKLIPNFNKINTRAQEIRNYGARALKELNKMSNDGYSVIKEYLMIYVKFFEYIWDPTIPIGDGPMLMQNAYDEFIMQTKQQLNNSFIGDILFYGISRIEMLLGIGMLDAYMKVSGRSAELMTIALTIVHNKVTELGLPLDDGLTLMVENISGANEQTKFEAAKLIIQQYSANPKFCFPNIENQLIPYIQFDEVTEHGTVCLYNPNAKSIHYYNTLTDSNVEILPHESYVTCKKVDDTIAHKMLDLYRYGSVSPIDIFDKWLTYYCGIKDQLVDHGIISVNDSVVQHVDETNPDLHDHMLVILYKLSNYVVNKTYYAVEISASLIDNTLKNLISLLNQFKKLIKLIKKTSESGIEAICDHVASSIPDGYEMNLNCRKGSASDIGIKLHEKAVDNINQVLSGYNKAISDKSPITSWIEFYTQCTGQVFDLEFGGERPPTNAEVWDHVKYKLIQMGVDMLNNIGKIFKLIFTKISSYFGTIGPIDGINEMPLGMFNVLIAKLKVIVQPFANLGMWLHTILIVIKDVAKMTYENTLNDIYIIHRGTNMKMIDIEKRFLTWLESAVNDENIEDLEYYYKIKEQIVSLPGSMNKKIGDRALLLLNAMTDNIESEKINAHMTVAEYWKTVVGPNAEKNLKRLKINQKINKGLDMSIQNINHQDDIEQTDNDEYEDAVETITIQENNDGDFLDVLKKNLIRKSTDNDHENSSLVDEIIANINIKYKQKTPYSTELRKEWKENIKMIAKEFLNEEGATLDIERKHENIDSIKGWGTTNDKYVWGNVLGFPIPGTPYIYYIKIDTTTAVIVIDKVAFMVKQTIGGLTVYWNDKNALANEKLVSGILKIMTKFGGTTDKFITMVINVFKRMSRYVRVIRDELVWRIKAATLDIVHYKFIVNLRVNQVYLMLLDDNFMISRLKYNNSTLVKAGNYYFYDRRSKKMLLNCHTHIRIQPGTDEFTSEIHYYCGKPITYEVMKRNSQWLQHISMMNQNKYSRSETDDSSSYDSDKSELPPMDDLLASFNDSEYYTSDDPENQRKGGNQTLDVLRKLGINLNNIDTSLIDSKTVLEVFNALQTNPLTANFELTMEAMQEQTLTDEELESEVSKLMFRELDSNEIDEPTTRMLVIMLPSCCGKSTFIDKYKLYYSEKQIFLTDIDKDLNFMLFDDIPWKMRALQNQYNIQALNWYDNSVNKEGMHVLFAHYPEQLSLLPYKIRQIAIIRTDILDIKHRPWSVENNEYLKNYDSGELSKVYVKGFGKQESLMKNIINRGAHDMRIIISSLTDMCPTLVTGNEDFYNNSDLGCDTLWIMPNEGRVIERDHNYMYGTQTINLVGGATEINRPTIHANANATFNAISSRLHGIVPMRKQDIESDEYMDLLEKILKPNYKQTLSKLREDPIRPDAQSTLDWLINKGHKLELLGEMVTATTSYDRATDYTNLSAHFKVENLMKERVEDVEQQIGRAIVWNNQNINMIVCQVVNKAKQNFKAILNDNLVTYADGLDMVTMNKRCNEIKKSKYLTELDLSKQDRQTDFPIIKFEHDLLLTLGVAPEIVQYMETSLRGLNITTPDMVQSHRPIMRLSGGAMTSLGNVVRNLLIVADICNHYEVNHVMVLGDDSIFFSDDEMSEEWISKTAALRHNVAATFNSSTTTGLFLQCIIGYIPAIGYRMCANFVRLRERLSVMSYEFGSDECNAKFASYLMMIGHSHLTANYASKLGITVYPALGTSMQERLYLNELHHSKQMVDAEFLINEIVSIMRNPVMTKVTYTLITRGNLKDFNTATKVNYRSNLDYSKPDLSDLANKVIESTLIEKIIEQVTKVERY